MTREEFEKLIPELEKEMDYGWHIHPNSRMGGGDFSMGYYYDETDQLWKGYQIEERGLVYEDIFEVETEEEAIDYIYKEVQGEISIYKRNMEMRKKRKRKSK